MAYAIFDGSAVNFGGKVFKFQTDDLNHLQVAVYDTDGTFLGTPNRYNIAGDGRVAGDRPNVSPTSFITEGGVDGPITSG